MPNKNSKILDDLILKNGIYLVIILLFIIALCIYDSKWIIPSIFIFIYRSAKHLPKTVRTKNSLQ